MYVATLVASLSSIAWLLNLRGAEIPFNPSLFLPLPRPHNSLHRPCKVTHNVRNSLNMFSVERKEHETARMGLDLTIGLICDLMDAYPFPVHGCFLHHRRHQSSQERD